ncbi:MAG TPA: Mov34/MPN/PAD-1 family protein [Methanocorpusculum sp.]|nr:Mov34/MPN/PAD-1 family protein [Methanocorpusculum sp.]
MKETSLLKRILKWLFGAEPKVHAIEHDLLVQLLEMGKSSVPNEYMVLLSAENGVINMTYQLPGSGAGEDASYILMDMKPLGMSYVGTAHSHPGGVIMPSDTDYATFAETGQVHIIVGEPFDEYSWRAFNRDGKQIKLDIVYHETYSSNRNL